MTFFPCRAPPPPPGVIVKVHASEKSKLLKNKINNNEPIVGKYNIPANIVERLKAAAANPTRRGNRFEEM